MVLNLVSSTLANESAVFCLHFCKSIVDPRARSPSQFSVSHSFAKNRLILASATLSSYFKCFRLYGMCASKSLIFYASSIASKSSQASRADDQDWMALALTVALFLLGLRSRAAGRGSPQFRSRSRMSAASRRPLPPL